MVANLKTPMLDLSVLLSVCAARACVSTVYQLSTKTVLCKQSSSLLPALGYQGLPRHTLGTKGPNVSSTPVASYVSSMLS